MTTITVRISAEEKAYLEKLSLNKNLCKTSKEISLGKVLKSLLAWCEQANFEPETQNQVINSNQKMIEQMHASIPHILYLLRMHILLDSGKFSDEVIAHSKRQAIDYINAVCGAFQMIDYAEIKPQLNGEGLPQLPIEATKTAWKIGK